jgi:hypothetical protein
MLRVDLRASTSVARDDFDAVESEPESLRQPDEPDALQVRRPRPLAREDLPDSPASSAGGEPRSEKPYEGSIMSNPKSYVCPRCDYPLVPVHSIEGQERHVIALTCPEPYCDHVQMIPRTIAQEFERRAGQGSIEPALRKAAH